ncbi:hypothetical protein [Ruminococcus sp.]|uniref:hypothetical protein n=1 Tax=Ruminococcus sp. TaxID=41978 RepID=UPI002E7A1F51|nr:hypothetical protein [Ruminococcus sp.]MEE1261861.1 hypothetical protein [Ruminococcus sp.]
MRNNSKPFRGIKLSPSTIKVTDSKRPSLLEGQQVVVFKPTDIAIATDTGRKIGNKERILGVGRVVIDGKDTLVELVDTSKKKRCAVVKPRIAKTKKKKHIGKVYSRQNVFLKAVEE